MRKNIKPEELISQAEAARLRGVSQQAIANLIRRGRLASTVVADRTLVSRAEVKAFIAKPKLGRPPKNAVGKMSIKRAKSKK